ncbi:MAG: hypothetical protein QM775_29120 [Pirellulales bacterium]
MSLRVAVAGLLFGLVACGVGAAAEYKDPQGFRVTYPDGWTKITKEDLANEDALPKEFREWIQESKIDLTRISVVVVRDGEEGEAFRESLNVVVIADELPLDSRTIGQVGDLIKVQLEKTARRSK